jgi:tRNA G18 (ribose-2'-O)-methylase SpoU
MSEVQHVDPDDPRLEPYRHLKRTNLTRWSGRFIAEGEKVVERLLASRFATESVLVSAGRRDFLARIPEGVAALVLPDAECERLTGYEFHQGVLACGVRQASPALETVLPAGRVTVAVAPRMTDPDNLGTLLRLAAGFGLDAVVLGPGSADPFSRRTLRVSMGAALAVPVVEAADLSASLAELRSHGVELVATVLDEDAEPLMTAGRRERMAVLFGNEAHGLAPAEVAACDRAVTIPMAATADSLNVAAAAAVVLYQFMRVVGR